MAALGGGRGGLGVYSAEMGKLEVYYYGCVGKETNFMTDYKNFIQIITVTLATKDNLFYITVKGLL